MATDTDKQEIPETNRHVLGSELRDAIARSLTRIQPNIQFKILTRLVDEFEVELKNLRELQENEE